MSGTFGVLALARPTFDVPFAEQNKDAAFAALDAAGITTVGSRELLFDGDAVNQAMAEIEAAGPVDLILLLQVTFTDASMTVAIASGAEAPVALWGLPEPRAGGRLRLNSLCGINLAAHALANAGIAYRWLFSSPDAEHVADRLRSLNSPVTTIADRLRAGTPGESPDADRVMETLSGARIGLVGQHPEGFDTCDYDSGALARLAGVKVEQIGMGELFDRARAVENSRVAESLANVEESLDGVGELDPQQMDRSLRVYNALKDLQRERQVTGMAVRCWPEMFTEYGCAACGPMAMMNQNGVPCACEADVYGSLSTLIMQTLSGEPVWMADLVDLDTLSDTAVLWHCGLAPLSMCDPAFKPEATVHTNRQMPLLHQFPLKAGRVTIARVSQAKGETKLVLAGAEMLRAPMPFTGTSGTLKFDRDAGEVLEVIMEEGLEHHYALAYGDYREALRAVAGRMAIPVLEVA